MGGRDVSLREAGVRGTFHRRKNLNQGKERNQANEEAHPDHTGTEEGPQGLVTDAD